MGRCKKRINECRSWSRGNDRKSVGRDTKREFTTFAHSDAGKVVIKATVGGAVTVLGYPAASGVAQQLVEQIK
jgi:hypothetical protein